MNITNIVNKTAITGSEKFMYNIKATFNASSKAEIRIFMPKKIKYELPPITGKLQKIDIIKEETGDKLSFNFGTVTSSDIVEFNLLASFGVGRIQNDTFTCTASIYLNDILAVSSTAEPVNLTLIDNFIILKTASGQIECQPGGDIYYKIYLTNYGDYGVKINNIQITDAFSDDITIDKSFKIIGNDVSKTYKDNHLDGKEGTIIDDVVIFDMDYYEGEKYEIIIKAVANSSLKTNHTIKNTSILTVDGRKQDESSFTVKVIENKLDILLSVDSEHHVTGGTELWSKVSFCNKSTVSLDTFEVECDIPKEVILKFFKFYLPKNKSDTADIYIKTNIREEYFLIKENVYNHIDFGDLSEILEENEYLINVKLITTNYQPFYLNGLFSFLYQVKNNIETSFDFNASLEATSTIGNKIQSESHTVNLNNKSSLNIDTIILNEKESYNPTDIVNVQLKCQNYETYIKNPVLCILLPKELQYVKGNEYYTYYESFYYEYRDSREGTFPFMMPQIELIKNYNDTGFTLLRYIFKNVTYACRNYLSIYLTLQVSIGTQNNFKFTSYMGDPTIDATMNPLLKKPDINDYDKDNVTNEDIVSHTTKEYDVLYTKTFNINGAVKGNNDNDYTQNGSGSKDGNIRYKIDIINNQEANLNNFEIIDILPSIGDTEVLTENLRGSQYNMNLKELPITNVINILTGESTILEDIKYLYSSSINPIRYNYLGEIIGDGIWENSILNLKDIRSIKIITPPTFILKPYEKLNTMLICKIDESALYPKKAYNSFSVKADVTSSDPSLLLLPTEVLKTSLQINGARHSFIKSHVWNDLNKNGINDNEPGINGLTVELYDYNKIFIKDTVTKNYNVDGYYEFNHIPSDDYYVKFIQNNDYVLTKQEKDKLKGSKPNPITEFTDKIYIKPSTTLNDIDAGFINLVNPVIYAKDKIVDLYSIFDPLDGVTAKDCGDNDITDDIVVVANNVNTNIIGDYNVTYSVTDSYNKTSTLTITITVLYMVTREKVINNLINSVALEQDALASIIRNESLKIKRATDLNYKNEDLIKINNSVDKMLNTVSNLETILIYKINLFDCDICK